jgi:hypothetical protein
MSYGWSSPHGEGYAGVKYGDPTNLAPEPTSLQSIFAPDRQRQLGRRQSQMASTAIRQRCLLQDVATVTGCRARFATTMDALHLGVYTGEITLQQLLVLPHYIRKSIAVNGPYIDVFLGETHVYKRTSKTLLFAFAPNVGQLLVPMNGQFVVRLPHDFVNVLAVKLAVLYMEQCLLSPRVLDLPWQVRGDAVDYILLSQFFAFMGMSQTARKLEVAILIRLREQPLRTEQIRAIWGREKTAQPFKYSTAMADNIFSFHCVPEIELFDLQFDDIRTKGDIKQPKTKQERIQCKLFKMALTLPGSLK